MQCHYCPRPGCASCAPTARRAPRSCAAAQGLPRKVCARLARAASTRFGSASTLCSSPGAQYWMPTVEVIQSVFAEELIVAVRDQLLLTDHGKVHRTEHHAVGSMTTSG